METIGWRRVRSSRFFNWNVINHFLHRDFIVLRSGCNMNRITRHHFNVIDGRWGGPMQGLMVNQFMLGMEIISQNRHSGSVFKNLTNLLATRTLFYEMFTPTYKGRKLILYRIFLFDIYIFCFMILLLIHGIIGFFFTLFSCSWGIWRLDYIHLITGINMII